MRHAARTGLISVGSARKNSKLNEVVVSQIFILSRTLKPAAIGVKFGVAPRTIRDVLNGVSWKHVCGLDEPTNQAQRDVVGKLRF